MLVGKRVHLAQYLAHISPSISPNPPGTRTSRGVRWGLPLSQHICVYKQRPLQFTWPPRQGAICRVHVFKRSCSHFSQVCHAEVCPAQSLNDRNARTQTKEGKTQANHGFFVVLAYFWQRSEADAPWGQCGICSCDVGLVKTVCHGMMWFLASAGWVLLLLLLLLRCAVLLLVVGCCQLLLVCWRWLATVLLVSCCWLGAACCLAAAGLLLPACCCCLAAAGYLLLLLGCWCCFAAGWLLPLPLPALQSLLICCWLLLRKPYHCGSVRL